MKDKVVFKRSFKGILLFILGVLAFVFAGIWMISLDEVAYRIIGIVSIIFFGIGGLWAVCFGILWKPIAIVSSEGITSYSRAGKKQFVPWSNIKRVEILTQKISMGHTEKYIGVFAIDNALVEGAQGAFARNIERAATKWSENPALLITTHFSNVTHAGIIDVAGQFHQAYKEQLTVLTGNEGGS